MAYSTMEALFDGRIIPWERRVEITDERRDIEKRIESEKRYFISKMSPDDCERFKQLDELYRSAAHSEEIDIYSHGFTLGAMLILEVLGKQEKIINK